MDSYELDSPVYTNFVATSQRLTAATRGTPPDQLLAQLNELTETSLAAADNDFVRCAIRIFAAEVRFQIQVDYGGSERELTLAFAGMQNTGFRNFRTKATITLIYVKRLFELAGPGELRRDLLAALVDELEEHQAMCREIRQDALIYLEQDT